MQPSRKYNPVVALVLAVFLGFLGVDRFYTGNVVAGVIKLLTLGGLGVWWIIDIILFGVETFQRTYSYTSPIDTAPSKPADAPVGELSYVPAPAPSRKPERTSQGRHVSPMPRGKGLTPWTRPSTRTEVVGEYYRPEDYEAIFAGMPRDGSFSNFDRTAALYPDPSNPHSTGSAVSVWIEGHHAGFLAGTNSVRYAPTLRSLAEQGTYLEMGARVSGRFDKRRRQWIAEVGIDLPEPNQILPLNQMPSAEHVLLPAGRKIQVTEETRHMDVIGPLTGDGDVPYVATLHAIHEVRPRSSFRTVEVRIDEEPVGILSKISAEKMLPMVELVESRGLIPAVRASLTGNSLSAEVTLNVVTSAEADPQWVREIEARPLQPRSAESLE